ncbi:MAG TPA: hypothetical protein K8V32_00635 [Enteractinococcus helveticum]|uniref:Uncharacterized protein n=1 Tax=Enteractinococcus helveticum TaxID=1837282 RepID=A0A921K6I1_9MICC|nr:hypothetical protein [Enteractinococcus helveticum]HJF13296.1 hypothetical protein [Enteractinococcus helveticum]
MRTLVDWISEQAGDDRPVMAAYPLSYDWMWVYWYLMRYAGTSPFWPLLRYRFQNAVRHQG